MKKRLLTILLFMITLILIRFGIKAILLRNPVSDISREKNESIPVLMYHSIKYEKGNPVRLPKEKFQEQMKYLKDNNYNTLTLDQLYDFLKNNKPIPKKSIVLTFDDGYKDNYETAIPILKKYNFKATFFIISDCIGTGEYLTLDQLKEMQKDGFDIESHTTNHHKLTKQSYESQYNTLLNSKEKLEKLLNKKIKYVAYPYGKYNKDTIKAVKAAGYKMAVTTHCKWTDRNEEVYKISRVGISGKHDIVKFINKINYRKYCRVYKYLLL